MTVPLPQRAMRQECQDIQSTTYVIGYADGTTCPSYLPPRELNSTRIGSPNGQVQVLPGVNEAIVDPSMVNVTRVERRRRRLL